MRFAIIAALAAQVLLGGAASAVTISFVGPVDAYFVAPGTTSRATSSGTVTFDAASGVPYSFQSGALQHNLFASVLSGSITFTGLLDVQGSTQDSVTFDASTTRLYVNYDPGLTRISIATDHVEGGWNLYAAEASDDSLTNFGGGFPGAYFTNHITAIDGVAVDVPEPASALLLTAAVGGIAASRRRRAEITSSAASARP